MKKSKASNQLILLLMKFFNDDRNKIDMWLLLSNELLGGCSPNDMIRFGREDKLIEFVQKVMIDGNYP